ncbi:MAG TPA: hypothetical protein VMB50_11070 [Myxococcales bacterium]|nr:hypothetical protein [Myxococcales bacterium]
MRLGAAALCLACTGCAHVCADQVAYMLAASALAVASGVVDPQFPTCTEECPLGDYCDYSSGQCRPGAVDVPMSGEPAVAAPAPARASSPRFVSVVPAQFLPPGSALPLGGVAVGVTLDPR